MRHFLISSLILYSFCLFLASFSPAVLAALCICVGVYCLVNVCVSLGHKVLESKGCFILVCCCMAGT